MTKIKYCGLKNESSIQVINDLKKEGLEIDFAGFILCKGRRRSIDHITAKILREKLISDIPTVGVFVDDPVEEVVELFEDGIINIAQMHGKEDEDYIAELKKKTGIYIIKAFSVDTDEDIQNANESLADMILLDRPGGGTGQTVDWSRLEHIERPYILAGGLGLDNINEALENLHPYGVDISSGIETDGEKDFGKMKAFVHKVREYDKRIQI